MLLHRSTWERESLFCCNFVPGTPVQGAHVGDDTIPADYCCHGLIWPHELAQALSTKSFQPFIQSIHIQVDRLTTNFVLYKTLQYSNRKLEPFTMRNSEAPGCALQAQYVWNFWLLRPGRLL